MPTGDTSPESRWSVSPAGKCGGRTGVRNSDYVLSTDVVGEWVKCRKIPPGSLGVSEYPPVVASRLGLRTEMQSPE
jgi:hypothetical protein